MTPEEKRVIEIYCAHEMDIFDSWLPLPSTYVSKLSGLSLYKTRKIIKKFVDEGYLAYNICGGQNEDGAVFCARGYKTTAKVIGLQEHKNAFDAEKKLLLDVNIQRETYEEYCEYIRRLKA